MASWKAQTERRVQNMENDCAEDYDDDDDGDDMDIIRNTSKRVTLTIDTDSDQEDISPKSGSGKKRKHSDEETSERIAFSDQDEPDAAYLAFKNRKADSRKRAAARTRKAKADANGSSIVGRKPRTEIKLRNPPRLKKNNTYGSDSDNDDETSIPQFLRQRRSEWEKHRQELGEAGLQLPPTYDDVAFSDDERLQELREKPVLPQLKPCAPYEDVELRYSAGIVPAPIAQWLRDYQVKGAEFLHELFVFQKGGLLGDDMGLGKTIQVIAFLTAAFGKTGDERDVKRMRKMRRLGLWYPKVLIVCPGGLMENWKSELKRWGWWHVDVFHGTPAIRENVLAAARSGHLEIMITTYTTYKNHRSAINLTQWDCIVADECHQIKERTSEITKAMNEVNALCRVGLTGTAIQNKYEELWTILNWTNPGTFGPLSAWKASISEPLKLGQSHDATIAQLAKARKTAKKLVQNLLPNFFLRRMKSLIADQLPKKTDKVVFCPLTEIQATAYENLVDSELIQAIQTSSDDCDCGSGKKRGWCCGAEVEGHGKWQHLVFPMLVTLQKLANHLAMLIPTNNDAKDKQERDLECVQIAFPDRWKDFYRDRDSIMNYANQEYCGKWKVLKKLLTFWHQNGDKVLVFSHSVRLLRMLQMLFKSTTTYNVCYLDGKMSYEERALAVDDFNTNPTQFVFLISTRAGGVGLNITSANKVVVFDPNWNPSYDLQAQDRAYRIGQTRDVEVFRLVSAGTVEEVVYARQVYKQQQANIAYNASIERRYFRGVQDNKDKKGEIFGLANIFSFQSDNIILQDIVNKTNIAESKAGVSVVGLDSQPSQESNGLEGDGDSGDADEDWMRAAGDKEDAAISQLAALLTDDDDPILKRKAAESKKIDAIAAILAGAGVEYTHENSEVVGSSKIETKLSRRAEAAGNDLDVGGDYVFAKPQVDPKDALNVDFEDIGIVNRKYNPPEHVRKRQFVSMARHFGYPNATDFALIVESWTQEQRRNCLERFYADRQRLLA